MNFITAIALFLMASSFTAHAASIDVDNMDYQQLMALLQESENLIEDNAAVEEEEVEMMPMPEPEQMQPQEEAVVPPSRNSLSFQVNKPSASSLLSPHVEILRIVESFLALKGEMGARIHALINDNFDLFRAIYNLVVSKASKLHSFTLVGISVIRRILEFAVQMIGTWELTGPSISVSLDKIFTNRP